MSCLDLGPCESVYIESDLLLTFEAGDALDIDVDPTATAVYWYKAAAVIPNKVQQQ